MFNELIYLVLLSINFDLNDIKSILISVVSSVCFAIIVYISHGYWKNRRDKRKEQIQHNEYSETKKNIEDLERNSLLSVMSEVDNLYNHGFFADAIKKSNEILSNPTLKKYKNLFINVKIKKANSLLRHDSLDDNEKNILVALDIYFEILKDETIINDSDYTAIINENIGICYGKLSFIRMPEYNLEQSITYFQLSLDYFMKTDIKVMKNELKRHLATSYSYLSEIKNKENNLRSALKFISEVVADSEKNDDYYLKTTSLASILLELSNFENTENNITLAIEYYEDALRNVSIEKEPFFYASLQGDLARAYTGLAKICDEKFNISKAIEYTEEALKIFTLHDSPQDYATACNNLGLLYLQTLKIDNSYNETIFSKGINLIHESLKLYSVNKYPKEYAMTMYTLGQAYKFIMSLNKTDENYKLARSYYENAMKIFTPNSYPELYKSCIEDIKLLEEMKSS
ncbi:MAG: tetratricopeptide repeat protein [Sediminibacterium sp. Gen4]|jgi:tetratricopeptide (TPR) repeat protein|uniref:tetratricopeptide repeat protein n=2 Tax=unclassified Sediminibacterium TaxID=2635961 RepID=UPI0015B8AC2C|nr:tetratricopeptide repeat protein [Sediminibacterium sp. Gen4]NWK64447.1 tetratricopeptide repeat protein [Sediminibacterium sp. Gen4]